MKHKTMREKEEVAGPLYISLSGYRYSRYYYPSSSFSASQHLFLDASVDFLEPSGLTLLFQLQMFPPH